VVDRHLRKPDFVDILLGKDDVEGFLMKIPFQRLFRFGSDRVGGAETIDGKPDRLLLVSADTRQIQNKKKGIYVQVKWADLFGRTQHLTSGLSI